MNLSLGNIIPMAAIFFEYLPHLHKKAEELNLLMHKVPKRPDTLKKACSKYCKVFKVCLAIFGHFNLTS